jgi:hypothetical protein
VPEIMKIKKKEDEGVGGVVRIWEKIEVWTLAMTRSPLASSSTVLGSTSRFNSGLYPQLLILALMRRIRDTIDRQLRPPSDLHAF